MTSNEVATILEEIRAARREQRRDRMVFILVQAIVLVLIFLTRAAADDNADLNRDLGNFPREEQKKLVYFTLYSVPEEKRAELLNALKFSVVSMTRTIAIEPTIPVQVGETLYRTDLRVLKWDKVLPQVLDEKYPYNRVAGRRMFIIRADWFIHFFLDSRYSGDLYQQLLFGQSIENETDYFKIFGADVASPFRYTWIEDNSGVALQKTRTVNVAPTKRHEPLWFTRDNKAPLVRERDPLENLIADPKHDASEVIAALPKRILASGSPVHVQAYALFNGDGLYQNNAPIDIVHDFSGTGPELRTPISCISCHQQGLLDTNVNSLRRFVESGAEAFADAETRAKIEAKFLTNLEKRFARWNEDYAEACDAICGLQPQQVSAAVRTSFLSYRNELTLQTVSRELRVPEDRIQAGLSRIPAGEIPARVAQLAHGVPIARDVFEEHYRDIRNAVRSNP